MQNVQTVFVYIEKEDRVLLVQEAGQQPYGLWCLPGGHVDLGEELEKAAIREAKEETGYEIELINKLGTRTVTGIEYKGPPSENHMLVDVHLFSGRIVSGDLGNTDGELLDVAWFAKDHAVKLPLRWSWLQEYLK